MCHTVQECLIKVKQNWKIFEWPKLRTVPADRARSRTGGSQWRMWWIATPKLKCWLRVVLFLATGHRKADTCNVREMHLFLWCVLTKEWDFFWIWKGKRKKKKCLLSQRAVADFYLACDKQQSVVRVEKKDRKKSVSVSRTKRTRGKRGILRAVAILLPITTQTYDIMHTHWL